MTYFVVFVHWISKQLWFRPVPKPQCWPPSHASGRQAELLAYAAARDPVGDCWHTIFAAAFLFCLPLASTPAGIAMGVLGAYWLLRLPTTWRCMTPLLTSRLTWVVAVWVCYTGLSILWSPDPELGRAHIGAMRMLAIPMLLLPVLPHWRWLLGAVIAGVFVQNSVQISQVVLQVVTDGSMEVRAKGLSHPGHVGLWSAAAVLFWASLGLVARGWQWAAVLLGGVAALAGLLYSGGRGDWVGFVPSLLVVLGVATAHQTTRRRAGIIGASCVVLSATLVPFALPMLEDRVQQVYDMAFIESDGSRLPNGPECRLVWWRAGWEYACQNPFLGNGNGGFRGAIEDTEVVQDEISQRPQRRHRAAGKRFLVRHPHSVWVRSLVEGGFIGLLFPIVLVLMVLGFSIRRAVARPALVWIPAVTVLWCFAGAFECLVASGETLSILGGLMFALIVLSVESRSFTGVYGNDAVQH